MWMDSNVHFEQLCQPPWFIRLHLRSERQKSAGWLGKVVGHHHYSALMFSEKLPNSLLMKMKCRHFSLIEIGHEYVQTCNLPEMRCPQGQVNKGSKKDVLVMAFWKDRSCN
jgi:hypothetical protein